MRFADSREGIFVPLDSSPLNYEAWLDRVAHSPSEDTCLLARLRMARGQRHRDGHE
jgi:hypothetical protein